jgi:galactokinase
MLFDYAIENLYSNLFLLIGSKQVVSNKNMPLQEEKVKLGGYEKFLTACYGKESLTKQRARYQSLLKSFTESFPTAGSAKTGSDLPAALQLFSAPGRTELGGNHTDHNQGKVLAAGVQLDTIAAVMPNQEHCIRLQSDRFPDLCRIDLNDLEVRDAELGTSAALIRGMAACFIQAGYKVGGFDAYVMSDVLPGSGLSSSAAFEVLIGAILNRLYNQGKLTPVNLAQMGQYAENAYFGKPCGLMDQLACACGGIIAIDFKDPVKPMVKKLPFDFHQAGYELVVINTGGSHADLTADYAAITGEMKDVARHFGKKVLREVDAQGLLAAAASLRQELGDRAVLRALHYFEENKRVDQMLACLRQNDMSGFLQLVGASGRSSWQLLQNCYSPAHVREQGVALALALTAQFLGDEGAWRVHGGGFAGTIQAYVPVDKVDDYRLYMEKIFGKGCLTALTIRPRGVYCLTEHK